MLSNKVVFLAQRCTKFKKKCARWNNFLRMGRGRDWGEVETHPCFSNLTPLLLTVPAQVLALFSFFRQLVNHTTRLTQNATGHSPSLSPWVSVDDPQLRQGDCVCESSPRGDPQGRGWGVPGAHQDGPAPVPSGSLLHNARLSLHPGLRGTLICCWQGF